jgi:PAS domain S-box-containing protein
MASAKPRNDLLSVILDMADVPIFGIDANGRVNLLNRAFSDMTGFHGAEILEMTSVQVKRQLLLLTLKTS